LDDFKNVKQLTEYDWDQDCLMTEQVPKTILGKKSPQPVAEKLNYIDMSGANFSQGNFAQLHKTA